MTILSSYGLWEGIYWGSVWFGCGFLKSAVENLMWKRCRTFGKPADTAFSDFGPQRNQILESTSWAAFAFGSDFGSGFLESDSAGFALWFRFCCAAAESVDKSWTKQGLSVTLAPLGWWREMRIQSRRQVHRAIATTTLGALAIWSDIGQN